MNPTVAAALAELRAAMEPGATVTVLALDSDGSAMVVVASADPADDEAYPPRFMLMSAEYLTPAGAVN